MPNYRFVKRVQKVLLKVTIKYCTAKRPLFPDGCHRALICNSKYVLLEQYTNVDKT